MLSKVLEADEAGKAQPLVWRRAAQTGVSPPVGAIEPPASQGQLAELQQECELRARESYEAGLREGLTRGAGEATAKIQAVLDRLGQSIAELAGVRAQLVRKAEGDVVQLAMEIARRVLHRELTVDPAALEGLVRVALDKLQEQEIHRVRVHPDHAKLVREQLAKLGRGSGIEVIGDDALPAGGAVFDMGSGYLDASIDAQLREIERGLTDRLKASS